MIHFDLPKEQSSIIKVIGVGGGGSNAVNHMFDQKIDGVDFIICNTDAQAIATSKVPNKIQLGPHLTQGLGAGANPSIGRQATEESLEEIKRILEVNTKMAFITAGMGGGTGTGGAPIIAQICKKLGILTVGIVTTPFGYEGRKRMHQAQEGINLLKDNVDTLLVISNDKLRHQFGNLKMKEAFGRADNVLATAAKCITDVINSTGQINVDFADVCTVMRDGGVAILGSAAASGEGRAQTAIECALTSPLLNDSDIRGAKWILININSAEGEHEFTMDEVEIIQNHLIEAAGEDTDVILGMGYDNSLGDQIGITLIATGFNHQDPFAPKATEQEKVEIEKVVFKLEEPVQPVASIPLTKELDEVKPAETNLVIENESKDLLKIVEEVEQLELSQPIELSLEPQNVVEELNETKPEIEENPEVAVPTAAPVMEKLPFIEISSSADQIPTTTVFFEYNEKEEVVSTEIPTMGATITEEVSENQAEPEMLFLKDETLSDVSNSHVQLTKPSQIYAVQEVTSTPELKSNDLEEIPVSQAPIEISMVEPLEENNMPEVVSEVSIDNPVLDIHATKTNDVFIHADPVAEMPTAPIQTQQTEPSNNRFVFTPNSPESDNQEEISFIVREEEQTEAPSAQIQTQQNQSGLEELALPDETEDLRKRAHERLAKLRNLSFNVGSGDPNSEFETVPAYMRRSMDVQVQLADVETFYSHYTVKSTNETKIDTNSINKFLDGKRPD
ncbi:MAG: cell division protein FtsZ [Bacteroidota bacterium]